MTRTSAASLPQLEERIRAWGQELGLEVVCRQTNSEGEYVGWCQELGESAEGLVVNPGAWSHYSYAIHDALELARGPVVEVHLSDIESREDWRRHSVLADLAAHRVVGKGPEGYKEALGIPGTRIERLRETIEEPLLVTAAVNVRYLTGFESTNAAVLVEPERVRLFTDFRYAERARRLDGVEVEETKRHLYSDLPDRLDAGRLRGRRRHVRELRVPPRGRRGARSAAWARGGAAGRQGAGGARRDPARERGHDRTYERLVEESFAGRTEKELVWRMHQLFHESGADGLAFDIDIAAGPTAASPHALPGDRVVQEGDLVLVDAGAVVDGYCSDCTRTFAVGEISDSLRGVYEVVREAQQAGVDAVKAGVTGRDADAAARAVIVEAGYGENFGHGLGHGLGLLVHEAPYLRPSGRRSSPPATSSPSSRAST